MEPRKLTRNDVDTLIQEDRWDTLCEAMQSSNDLWEKRAFSTPAKPGEDRQLLGFISLFQRIYLGCTDEAVFIRLWEAFTVEQKVQALQDLKHLPSHLPQNEKLVFFNNPRGISPAETELLRVQMALSVRLFNARDYEGALYILCPLEGINNTTDYHYYYGLAAFCTKQWHCAIRHLHQVPDSSGAGYYSTAERGVHAYYLSGMAYTELAKLTDATKDMTNVKAAIADFHKMFASFPTEGRRAQRKLCSKALLQSSKLRLDLARRSLTVATPEHIVDIRRDLFSATEWDRTNWEAYYYIGETYKLQKDFKEAMRFYKTMPAENKWTTMAVVGLLQEISYQPRRDKFLNKDLLEVIMKLTPQDRANYLTLFSTTGNNIGDRIVPYAERRGFLGHESEEGRLLRSAKEELARLRELGIIGVVPTISAEVGVEAPGGAEGGAAAPRDDDDFARVDLSTHADSEGLADAEADVVRRGPGTING